MKTLKLRSMSAEALTCLSILLVIGIILPIAFYYFTLVSNSNSFDTSMIPVIVILGLIYYIPLIILLLYIVYHFVFQVNITNLGVTIRIPFRHNIFIQKDSISAYGIVFRGPRDTRIYFCSASREKIFQYYQNNMDVCKRMFRNGLYEEYVKSEQGCWFMAVYAYVMSKPKDVCFLASGNLKRVNLVSEILSFSPLNIQNYELIPCQHIK